MKAIQTILCLFLITSQGFSQEISERDLECGTPEMDAYFESDKPWFLNNNYFLEVLQRYGYDLPKDYFDSIDERGHYKGEKISLRRYKNDSLLIPKLKKGNPNSGRISAENLRLLSLINYIPLKVWVHQNSSNVSPFTQPQIFEVIDLVNELFANNDVPIRFYISCDITTIPSSLYNNLPSENSMNAMFNNFQENNVINLHLVASGFSIGSSGTIPSTNLFITPSIVGGEANRGLLVHELGHCLGLFHTHARHCSSSSYPNGNQNCNNCNQESVSRTKTQGLFCLGTGTKKCEFNGDQLCDTPAEPNLIGGFSASQYGVNESCQIVWPNLKSQDNWGDFYSPMQFNIMSYARSKCRNSISAGQIAKMLSYLPSFAHSSSGYQITGFSNVCNNVQYSYNVPSLQGITSYNWTVPEGTSIVSGQGTNTLTVSFGNSVGTNKELTVYPQGCGYPPVSIPINVRNFISILGPTSVGPTSTFNYSTQVIDNVVYQWSIPSSWTMQSGQGSHTIQVTTGGSGTYTLSVSASGYGCSKYAEIQVNVSGSGPIQRVDFHSTNEIPPNQKEKVHEPFKRELVKIIIIDPYSYFNMEVQSEEEFKDLYLNLKSGFYIIQKVYTDQMTTLKYLKR
ncbi:hypothetical protein [Aquiflexum sp.]|uniref:hypothetical protein n=1 Tax=Aquiflexum sp. TaxID=1872584 RepID=UPI003593BFFC